MAVMQDAHCIQHLT